MICTDAERDALMAAIRKYGDASFELGYDNGHDRSTAENIEQSEKKRDSSIAAIRAMLAPPDDAVVIPRDLAERSEIAFLRLNQFTHVPEYKAGLEADAAHIRSVLRGEATHDE